jgi:hypothetical protein
MTSDTNLLAEPPCNRPATAADLKTAPPGAKASRAEAAMGDWIEFIFEKCEAPARMVPSVVKAVTGHDADSLKEYALAL